MTPPTRRQIETYRPGVRLRSPLFLQPARFRLDRCGWIIFLDRLPTIAISRQRGLAIIANLLKPLRFSTAQNGYRFNPVELETSVI
jgi:hypothetical protein